MVRILVCFLFLVTIPLSSIASTEGDPGIDVNAKDFLTSIRGDYEILLAGGVKPKPDTNVAKVYAEPSDGAWLMPYCKEGGSSCDPGYVPFSYDQLKVTRWALAADHDYFVIVVNDGVTTTRYSWDQTPCSVTFSNYQYLEENNPVPFTLQHILKKK